MKSSEILDQIARIEKNIALLREEMAKGQNTALMADALKLNALELYQISLAMNANNTGSSAEKPGSVTAVSPPAAMIPEIPEPPVRKVHPVHTETADTVKTEIREEHAETAVKEKTPVAEKKSPVAAPEPPSILKNVKTEEEELSVNDKMQRNKQPVLNYAEKSKETPISDLGKAISIGKKFEFINGLFDGNADAYKDCLHKMQHSESYESAASYLENNIAGTYSWEENEKLAAEFFALVRRRFLR